MPVVSLAQMLESGVHFGHQTRRWNPKMAPYIFTERNGVHIIDLVQTAQLMEDAYEYMRVASEKGKKFLFVGTKRQAAGIVAQEAQRCGAYYVNQRWLGGMLTNWTTIKSRVERLKDLERREEIGALDLLPKKEASVLRREMAKLQKYLGGIKTMRKIPDGVVLVDQRREYNAVLECQKLGIPIVSLLDTNCDPDLVDIAIPANDDAIRSIKLIVGKLADAIYEGRHGQQVGEGDEDYDYEGGYEGAEYDVEIEELDDPNYVDPDEAADAEAEETES
ncbi:MAG: 30S ribosomal protein S2 [Microcoleus sp. CAN_BIN18]|nr:30S ribosomal protein S2 [Microcoleus sp. CAN_BIN18]